MSDSQSLSDKLKALGVNLGPQNLKPPKPKSTFPIEDVIPEGYDIATPYGNTFIREGYYPQDYFQGVFPLTPNLNQEILRQWGKIEKLANYDVQKICFLDTETSGLAGGTGTYPFMIGLGHFSSQGFHLVQLFMREPASEPAALASFSNYMNMFDVVVTYNGKSFDIPLLKTRHILNGFSNPFDGTGHIDLLHLARRIWKNRLESRTLGTVENEILGVIRTEEEIPGWLVPQIYFDYLHSGDARPLRGVFYHNAMDILSLAGLFNHCCDLLTNPTGLQTIHSLDLISLGKLFEDLEYIDKAVLSYEAGLEHGLPMHFFLDTLNRFALLHRRQNDWTSAIRLWEKAAEYEHIDAFIELAKYYEHHNRNYQEALSWVEKGIEIVSNGTISQYRRTIYLKDFIHRLERLKKKTRNEAT